MKVSRAIIDAIEKEGITHVFMVPGGIVDGFTNELSKTSLIKTIISAHEGGAIAMADGYSRASGKFGVAMCIGGPGIMNMMTGIYTAYMDHTPVLIVSGEVPTVWEGRGGFQDTSPHGPVHDGEILKNVTCMTCSVKSVTNFEFYIRALFQKMRGANSRGPVHLGVPADLQNAETNFVHVPPSPKLTHSRILDASACRFTPELIVTDIKMAIICGSGAHDKETSVALLDFAEKYNIPVVTTFAAKGSFPEDHPLSMGYLGWAGSRSALDLIFSEDLEVLIVLGSKLNMQDTLLWSKAFDNIPAIIQVDLDESSIGQHFVIQYPVVGDCLAFLRYVDRKLEKMTSQLEDILPLRSKWLADFRSRTTRNFFPEKKEADEIPIHPARVIAELRKVMPRNTILTVDTGAHGFFASHYWETYEPRQFISAISYVGAMGWAIAAGIGAKCARPNDPCVVITGDGCMLMHGMEIQTAARNHLDIIFVVINNSSLGNPYLRAQKVNSEFAAMLTLPTHKWSDLALALGVKGARVTIPDEIEPAIRTALAEGGTWVIDFICGNYPTPTEAFDESLAGGR